MSGQHGHAEAEEWEEGEEIETTKHPLRKAIRDTTMAERMIGLATAKSDTAFQQVEHARLFAEEASLDPPSDGGLSLVFEKVPHATDGSEFDCCIRVVQWTDFENRMARQVNLERHANGIYTVKYAPGIYDPRQHLQTELPINTLPTCMQRRRQDRGPIPDLGNAV